MKSAYAPLAALAQHEEKQEKRDTHEIFDRLWHFLPVEEAKKQQYRSVLYRVWGAVLAAELNNVDGVNNPRAGGQHISAMSSEHQEKCRGFAEYLIRKHKGKIWDIAATLSTWSSGFDSENKKTTDVQYMLNNDTFISTIRQALGIRSYTAKSKNPVEAPFTPLTPSIKEEAPLTSQDHFTEGLIAHINGDTATMLSHFRSAAERNHAEAAWFLWEHLDKNAVDAAGKREALTYLDTACRGLYWLAPLKIQELYREQPPIITPYLQELEAAAHKELLAATAGTEEVTSEAMNRLGLYHTSITLDNKTAKEWYEKAITTNNNHDARMNLYSHYSFNRAHHFLSKDEASGYYNIVMSEAKPDSHAAFSLRVHDKLENLKTTNIHNIEQSLISYQEEKDNGSIVAELLFHITRLIYNNHDHKVTKKHVNDSLTYLHGTTQYITGSKGDDSEYAVNYHNSSLDSKTIQARYSVISVQTLIQYYTRKGEANKVKYWQECMECTGKNVYPLTKIPIDETEKRNIGNLLMRLMGEGAQWWWKENHSPTLIATLLPEIEEAQRERAYARLKSVEIPVTREPNGCIHTETTMQTLKTGYTRSLIGLQQQLGITPSSNLLAAEHVPPRTPSISSRSTS